MKIILIWLIFFTLGSVLPAWADTAPSTDTSPWVSPNDSDNTNPPEKGTWFMQMNGDLDSPTGNLANAVNQGWGLEISVGYHLSKSFQVSVETGYDTYSEKDTAFNGSWNVTPLVLKGAYVISHGFVRPYVFLAAGMAFNSRFANFGSFTGSNSEADFLGEAGLGLSFAMGNRSSVFLQTKMELDGTSANYAADQPTILIPLNAGIKFALN
jgi:Outer membrane protein beta-barrel domain